MQSYARRPSVSPFDTTLALPDVQVTAPPAPNTWPSDLWLRRWTLSLGGSGTALGGPASGNQLILSTSEEGEGSRYDLRMTFEVRHSDSPTQTPGYAIITVYNLADSTAMQTIKEFTYVTLQAGYKTGKYGIIFEGQIKQFKKGRLNATDSYLTLFCADGDQPIHWGTINVTLPAGTTMDQVRQQLINATGLPQGHVVADKYGGLTNPRPIVLFGMQVDEAQAYAASTRQSWSVQNGQIQIVPWNSYLPGDIAVMNAATGVVGVPELTQDGLYVTCLLNPRLYIKGRIKLNNKDIAQYYAPGGGRLLGQQGQFPSNINALGPVYPVAPEDGIYCILVLDHVGDTRGLPWYTHIIALDVDPTSTSAPVQGADQASSSTGSNPPSGAPSGGDILE